MRNEVKISGVLNGINDENSFVSFILLSNGKAYMLNKKSFMKRFNSNLLKKYNEKMPLPVCNTENISMTTINQKRVHHE